MNIYKLLPPSGIVIAMIFISIALQSQAVNAEDSINISMIPIPGKNYEMGKYDVTQAEWLAVMGNNPSHFSSCGTTCPVESVSWNDTQEFIKILNTKTGKQYRLPTEAEWEYACYAESKTEYCGGNDLNMVAWYKDNSNGSTHPVGQKQANGYGLFDMSGNVWQWSQDRYGDENSWHILRGGSWNSARNFLQVSSRNGGPMERGYHMGFRLVRTLP